MDENPGMTEEEQNIALRPPQMLEDIWGGLVGACGLSGPTRYVSGIIRPA